MSEVHGFQHDVLYFVVVCFNDTLTAYNSLHLLRFSQRYLDILYKLQMLYNSVFGGKMILDQLVGKDLEEESQGLIHSSTLAFV